MKKLIQKISVAALASAPLLAFAQQQPVDVGIRSLRDIEGIITRTAFWIINLFWLAAVLYLVYAAWLYLTAGGDSTKLESAKNQLIYSIIAIVVALLATSVRFIVENVLRGGL